MARTGRNDPCPCESGKKYKQCCALKQHQMSRLVLLLLIAGAIMAVVVIVTSVRRSGGSGQVWSAEHGHYHDASGREVPR
jgi:SEC-C motif